MTFIAGRPLGLALAALTILSCRATTQLPLTSQTVELPMTTSQLVCHVRKIAASQQLSFHYGTSEQPYGTLATFRLIGDGFELVLYNPEKPTAFELQAYDMSKGEARERAQKAYVAFAQSVTDKPAGECAA